MREPRRLRVVVASGSNCRRRGAGSLLEKVGFILLVDGTLRFAILGTLKLLDERHEARREKHEVPGVDRFIRVRNSGRHEYRSPCADVYGAIGKSKTKRPLKDVPRLVVGVVHVKLRRPAAARQNANVPRSDSRFDWKDLEARGSRVGAPPLVERDDGKRTQYLAEAIDGRKVQRIERTHRLSGEPFPRASENLLRQVVHVPRRLRLGQKMASHNLLRRSDALERARTDECTCALDGRERRRDDAFRPLEFEDDRLL